MCDEWMPVIRLKTTVDEYERLPRNAAYKYEYLGAETIISPNPKTMHASLDLSACSIPECELAPVSEYRIVPMTRDLHDRLVPLFASAFCQTQPFASLTNEERLTAANASLTHAFDGEEGPWMSDASFVARRVDDDTLVGGILVTLLPEGDPADFETYRWPKSTPVEMRTNGQPHITWVFTHQFFKGDGVGTTMLAAAIDALRKNGHRRLLSTFIAGNDSSMLWHWRNGFVLAPYAGSHRRVPRRVKT